MGTIWSMVTFILSFSNYLLFFVLINLYQLCCDANFCHQLPYIVHLTALLCLEIGDSYLQGVNHIASLLYGVLVVVFKVYDSLTLQALLHFILFVRDFILIYRTITLI